MKIQGTPEEMQQAKDWWAGQKKRVDEKYKEAKKKDKNAKKDTSLVSPENKERTYRRHEVSFSQIKGDRSQKYLDNYLAKHSSQEDDWKKQLVQVANFGWDEWTRTTDPHLITTPLSGWGYRVRGGVFAQANRNTLISLCFA